MSNRRLSGLNAILYSAARGALVTTGALAANKWHEANAFASASALPVEKEGAIFETPDAAGTAITLVSGDQAYPLTLSQLAKVECSVSGSKGVIDVTDDTDEGYLAEVTDGFTSLSGSITGWMKFNDPAGGLIAAQKSILNRFFDVVDDDGLGVYTLSAKNDDDLIMMILMNSVHATTGLVQTWLISKVILETTSLNKPLKGGQNLDITWKKAQGWAGLYQRTLKAGDV